MSIFLHTYSGVLPQGDVFSFGFTTQGVMALISAASATADWINAFWNATEGYKTHCAPGTVLTKYRTTLYGPTPPLRAAAVFEEDADIPGTSTAASLPQEIAVLNSLRTGNPGSRGRGRFYLPAPTVDTVGDLGQIGESFQSDVLGLLTNAYTAISGDGLLPVITSRLLGTTQAVIEFGVGTLFDTQRRRTNKVNTVRTFLPMPGIA